MSAAWEKALQYRMPAARIRRGWMVWAIWAMLGTALTMEGTVDFTALTVSALLTAPFWAAFLLWPLFRLWRRLHDRRFWGEETEMLVHDPEGETPFGLPVIRGRHGLLLAVEAVVEAVPEAEAELKAVPRRAPEPQAGLNLETFEPESLEKWGNAYLEAHPEANGPVAELARWSNTFLHADRAMHI